MTPPNTRALDPASDETAVVPEPASTVVALPARATASWSNPRVLLERIYAAGSLLVPAHEREARWAVAVLASLGFLVVEEIQVNGTARRLGPGEAGRDSTVARARPWRVSRPAFGGGEVGVPDSVGARVEAQFGPTPVTERDESGRSTVERLDGRRR